MSDRVQRSGEVAPDHVEHVDAPAAAVATVERRSSRAGRAPSATADVPPDDRPAAAGVVRGNVPSVEQRPIADTISRAPAGTDTIRRLRFPWSSKPAPERPPAEVSAPFNVHVRSGEGPITPLDSIDSSLRPDPETFRLGDADLSPQARQQAAAQAAPEAAGGDEHDEREPAEEHGDEHDGGDLTIPTTEELGENDILYPSPSVEDIDLPTKPQAENQPVGVISAYRHYAGDFLKHAQRHDIKIERYARYFEADFAAVAEAKQEYEAAQAAVDTDKQAELTKKMGGHPIAEFEFASKRLERAHIAESAADKEIPLIDGVYEQARDTENEHKASTGGGGSIVQLSAKLQQLEAAAQGGLTGKKAAKNSKETAQVRDKIAALERARDESGRLGQMVKQSKLSEEALRVKRMGLKNDKQTVKKEKGRGVKLGAHLKKKAGVALGSALLSSVTLGVFAYNQEKTDGGYTSERRATPIWVRVKDEMRRIRETANKRPYGAVTSLHLALEGFGFIIKELRNILMSAALIAIGVSLIPGAAAIAGPVAGFCSTAAIALAALKGVIDLVLASWSVIERARNSNARNSDLLTSQAARQGTDLVGDAIAVGMAYGGAELGNAVHDDSPFQSPHERITDPTFSSTDQSLTPLESGNDRAAMAANVGSRQGAKLAGDAVKEAAFVEPISSTSLQNTKMRHLREDRRGGSGAPGDGDAPADAGSAPAWLKQAQAEEAEARRSSLQALITVHASKIKRFNAKTQNAMTAVGGLADSAPRLGDVDADGGAEAQQEQRERQEDVGAIGGMARGLREALRDITQLGGEVDNEQLRAHAQV